ncbi:orotate phosphoribosyltransferase [soil metagenome]
MDLQSLLESSGAILRGHFILTSGRRSDVYFEKFRVLERPDVLSELCRHIAQAHMGKGIELVVGPTTGGIIIACEVARQMGLPAAYIETEDGVKTFRRGKTLSPGTNTLVVDDVLTTGRSLVESREAVERAGGVVAGYAVLIDRSVDLDLGLPLFASYRVEARSWAPDEVPPELAAIPAVKPGTRK